MVPDLNNLWLRWGGTPITHLKCANFVNSHKCIWCAECCEVKCYVIVIRFLTIRFTKISISFGRCVVFAFSKQWRKITGTMFLLLNTFPTLVVQLCYRTGKWVHLHTRSTLLTEVENPYMVLVLWLQNDLPKEIYLKEIGHCAHKYDDSSRIGN